MCNTWAAGGCLHRPVWASPGGVETGPPHQCISFPLMTCVRCLRTMSHDLSSWSASKPHVSPFRSTHKGGDTVLLFERWLFWVKRTFTQWNWIKDVQKMSRMGSRSTPQHLVEGKATLEASFKIITAGGRNRQSKRTAISKWGVTRLNGGPVWYTCSGGEN